MEEKLLIQSERSYVKTLKKIVPILLVLLIVGVILFFAVVPALDADAYNFYNQHLTIEHRSYGDYVVFDDNYLDEIQPKWTLISIMNVTCYTFGALGIIGIILLVFLIAIAKMEINVTDKRVYGKAKFGKRVDLPFDSISAVATGMLNGIAVATSSGKIHFLGISNNKEIHEVISKQLIERQGKEKPVATTTITQEIPQSNADELKKYKELLDSGVITQEEFDAKKKQLLGL